MILPTKYVIKKEKIYKKPNVRLVHSVTNKHVLRVNLTEGKNREIRNICALFNLKVEKLKRISYGRFLLKSITYGEYAVSSSSLQLHDS